MHLDLHEKKLGGSLSHRNCEMRHASVDPQDMVLNDGKKKNRLISSNSSEDQVKSQMIVYQNIGIRDAMQPVIIESERSDRNVDS